MAEDGVFHNTHTFDDSVAKDAEVNTGSDTLLPPAYESIDIPAHLSVLHFLSDTPLGLGDEVRLSPEGDMIGEARFISYLNAL